MHEGVYAQLAKFESSLKQIAATTPILANANPVKALRCDFCGEGHANGQCVPEGYVEEEHYAGNYHKPDPYFNTYNPWWDDHSNLKWSNNQFQNFNQEAPQDPPPRTSSLLEETLNEFKKFTESNLEAMKIKQDPPPRTSSILEETLNQFKKFTESNLEAIKIKPDPPPRKPSVLEETLNQFTISQSNWEVIINKNIEASNKNTEASIKIENKIGQLSKQEAAQSSGGSYGNMLDNPRDDEVVREIESEWKVVDEGGVIKEKEETCTPADKKAKESEVRNRCGKRARMQYEDFLVLEEAPISTVCLDVDIQKESFQQKHAHEEYFSNKADERTEIDKVLDMIYALFATIKLKRIWRQHHQYLKFMEFLPNKRKKKDDVFFLSYMPP